jgi:biopolymer transport protein TolQ
MILSVNPFVNAYLLSDWFGKGIFWMLFFMSAASWSVLIFKCWQMLYIRRISREFSQMFETQKEHPLRFQYHRAARNHWVEAPHPYFEVYKTAKQNALLIMRRNGESAETLTAADLELIETQTFATAAIQGKALDQHLFILSTVVTLGPFLGLLGTVWGILQTFSQLPHGLSTGNSAMLSGLSMALATTVLGLVIAIPALVGFNYLKNTSREYKRELEHFSHCLLAAVEMQTRKE